MGPILSLMSSVHSGACGAPNFPGPAKNPRTAPPRGAGRGGAGDLFFFTPPRSPSGAPHFRGPVFTVFRGPFQLSPANSPFRVPGFRGAPPGAPLSPSNFAPGMLISGLSSVLKVRRIAKDSVYSRSGVSLTLKIRRKSSFLERNRFAKARPQRGYR